MPKLALLESKLQETLSKARLKSTELPFCRSIRLKLYDPDVLQGPISHDEAQKVIAEPAYWSFCWASGQVLANYILNHPETVTGQRVLDFGCGSGVVAIAAAKAGAKEVVACDIDPDALLAAQVNADLNNVSLNVLAGLDLLEEPVDVITAADVLYDRDNYPILDHFLTLSERVLLADSRVKELPSQQYQFLGKVEARTCPDLNEFEEFNLVRLYLGAPQI